MTTVMWDNGSSDKIYTDTQTLSEYLATGVFAGHSLGLVTKVPFLPMLLHPSTATAAAAAPGVPTAICGKRSNLLRKLSDRHIQACVSSSVVPGGKRSLIWQDVLLGSGKS